MDSLKKNPESSSTGTQIIINSSDAEVIQKSKKVVGLAEGLSLIVGSIVGSGIFIAVNPTFDVFSSDSIGMTLVFWVIGGIMSMLGALCYVELGTRIPESGGERAYFAEAINSKISTLFAVIFPFFIKSITLAALALTSGKYFLVMILPKATDMEYLEKIIAAITLISCFALNCFSKKWTNKLGIFFTILKLFALSIIIGIGIYFLCTGHVREWKQPFVLKGFDIVKLGICIINIEWSFEGWNVAGLVAGEMPDPARVLPISVILGVIIVVVMYALTIVSYTAILGYKEVRISETVAMSVALKVLKSAYPIIPLLIFFSALGAANGTFFTVGGLCMSGGCRGDLPKIFSLVHRNKRTPIFSLFIMLILSLLFLPFDFQVLLNYVAFMSWIFYFLSMCCIYILKRRKVTSKDPITIFNVPYVIVFIVQILCLFMIGMSFYLTYLGCLIFALIMIMIFAYQFIPNIYKDIGIISRIHAKTSIIIQKIFNLVEANEKDIS